MLFYLSMLYLEFLVPTNISDQKQIVRLEDNSKLALYD